MSNAAHGEVACIMSLNHGNKSQGTNELDSLEMRRRAYGPLPTRVRPRSSFSGMESCNLLPTLSLQGRSYDRVPPSHLSSDWF